MTTFIRLVSVTFVYAAVQACASHPTTPGPVEAARPATAVATADRAAATNPTAPPAKAQQVTLDDKTLTQAEVNRLISQGYKPQKGRGDDVLYCRREQQLGTNFTSKVCLTADQIKTRFRDSRDVTEQLQRNYGNPGPTK